MPDDKHLHLPLGLGRLDLGDWIYGLLAAFIGGGASAVTSGITLNMIDPKDFNIYTSKFYVMVAAMFSVNGLMSAMAFLRQKPLPEFKEVTTTVQTMESTPAKVVTTEIKEVKTVPVDLNVGQPP